MVREKQVQDVEKGKEMTKEEILNMPAGREMDVLIENWKTGVLAHYPAVWEELYTPDGKDGWEGFVCPRCGTSEDDYQKYPCAKHYSTDISAAFEVWTVLNSRGVWLSISDGVNSEEKDWLKGNKIIEFCKGWDNDPDYIEAETIPLGICRVALLVTITTP